MAHRLRPHTLYGIYIVNTVKNMYALYFEGSSSRLRINQGVRSKMLNAEVGRTATSPMFTLHSSALDQNRSGHCMSASISSDGAPLSNVRRHAFSPLTGKCSCVLNAVRPAEFMSTEMGTLQLMSLDDAGSTNGLQLMLLRGKCSP